MDNDLCNVIARRWPDEFSFFTILRRQFYDLSLDPFTDPIGPRDRRKFS